MQRHFLQVALWQFLLVAMVGRVEVRIVQVLKIKLEKAVVMAVLAD